jgi:carbon storage regulator
MLVLGRKKGEQIQIGDGVTLTVLQLSPGRVRLGIEAGKEISVIRGELAENDSSSSRNCDDDRPQDRERPQRRAAGDRRFGQDSPVEMQSSSISHDSQSPEREDHVCSKSR